MAACGRHGGSAKLRAVAALKREAVDGRYETLSDSTVRSWFGPDKTLLPRFQAQLDAGVAASRGGRPGSLPAAVEDEVKQTLQKLRDTGAPLKTARVLPEETAASKAARVHLTFSDNHWSSLTTMQQWVTKLLLPYAERCIQRFELNSNAHILLVLDCWAVHKSEEFRRWLRTQHPRIHLVFVPANCTSKLQVADVTLQRPFKATIRRCFEQWAAEEMRKQIASNEIVGFGGVFKMATLEAAGARLVHRQLAGAAAAQGRCGAGLVQVRAQSLRRVRACQASGCSGCCREAGARRGRRPRCGGERTC